MATQNRSLPALKLRPVARQRRFAGLRTVGALMLREMSTTYGRSWAGYFWAVAEPVAGIVLLTAIFSLALNKPSIGINFPIFYATGLIPFMFYQSISSKVASSITFSRALLGYPAVTYMDALMARALINAITELMVGYLVFTTILLFYDTRTNPQIYDIALAYAMVFVFAVGVGSVNCFLFARFPAWAQVWGILTRPLLLVSCIIHIFDDVPEKYQGYLWYNPLVHIVGQMRKGFYANYPGDYVSPAYVFMVGLGLLCVGLSLLAVYHQKIINEW